MESMFLTTRRALAAQVRLLRLERGLTQEHLAAAAELDVRHVQRIESGRANPELHTLCALATALATTPAGLLLANPNAEEAGDRTTR